MAVHQYTDTQTLQKPAQELFDLVMDIESYPKFLPWCIHARINRRLDAHNLEAVLGIGYGPLSENFTSHVTWGKEEGQLYIESMSIKGPIDHLNSRWIFKELSPNSCELTYKVSFEVEGGFLSKVLESVFHQIAESMVKAFKTKALQG